MSVLLVGDEQLPQTTSPALLSQTYQRLLDSGHLLVNLLLLLCPLLDCWSNLLM